MMQVDAMTIDAHTILMLTVERSLLGKEEKCVVRLEKNVCVNKTTFTFLGLSEWSKKAGAVIGGAPF